MENAERVIDGITHIGYDKDGKRQDVASLLTHMSDYGIERSVILPFDDPRGFHFANELLLRAVDKYPHKFIHFCRVDPKGKSTERELALRAGQGFRGLKLHPRSQKFEMTDERAVKIVRAAAKLGLPIFIHTEYSIQGEYDYIGDFSSLAKKVPKAKLIMGHSGMDFADKFANEILEVAKNPNVWFDVSTLIPEQVRGLIAGMGADRVIFGTDAPYDRPERVSGALAEIRKLPSGERMKVLCANLLRLVYCGKNEREGAACAAGDCWRLFIPVKNPSDALLKKIRFLPLARKEPIVTPVSAFGDFVSNDVAIYGIYKGKRLAVLADNDAGGIFVSDAPVNELRYGDERDCENYGKANKTKLELKKDLEKIF